MMKKLLVTLMILCVSAFALTACNDKTESEANKSEEEENVAVETLEENAEAEHYNRVSIFIGNEIMNTAKYPNMGEITVFELLKKLCDDEEIELSHLDGYVNGIAGYSNTGDEGWVYYFNGEMPDVGPESCTIAKGHDNLVEFKYLKYSEAFPEE